MAKSEKKCFICGLTYDKDDKFSVRLHEKVSVENKRKINMDLETEARKMARQHLWNWLCHLAPDINSDKLIHTVDHVINMLVAAYDRRK